jgi:hypothetical protein
VLSEAYLASLDGVSANPNLKEYKTEGVIMLFMVKILSMTSVIVIIFLTGVISSWLFHRVPNEPVSISESVVLFQIDLILPNKKSSIASGLKSINNENLAKLKYKNSTSSEVLLFWINFSGDPVFYAKLNPGEPYEILTDMTHPWVATDLNGNKLEQVKPELVVATQREAIQSKEADKFIEDGLGYARKLFGDPSTRVEKIQLWKAANAFTSLEDEAGGVFAIHVSYDPSESTFYGQLAHEIAHLLNARLYDAYVEGLNNVFAEKLIKRAGMDWGGWEKHFREGEDPFYAYTYFMMREVDAVAGEDAMHAFLGFARPALQDPKRMHIDINGWLETLPPSHRRDIKEIILKYRSNILNSMTTVAEKNEFISPD